MLCRGWNECLFFLVFFSGLVVACGQDWARMRAALETHYGAQRRLTRLWV